MEKKLRSELILDIFVNHSIKTKSKKGTLFNFFLIHILYDEKLNTRKKNFPENFRNSLN